MRHPRSPAPVAERPTAGNPAPPPQLMAAGRQPGALTSAHGGGEAARNPHPSSWRRGGGPEPSPHLMAAVGTGQAARHPRFASRRPSWPRAAALRHGCGRRERSGPAAPPRWFRRHRPARPGRSPRGGPGQARPGERWRGPAGPGRLPREGPADDEVGNLLKKKRRGKRRGSPFLSFARGQNNCWCRGLACTSPCSACRNKYSVLLSPVPSCDRQLRL